MRHKSMYFTQRDTVICCGSLILNTSYSSSTDIWSLVRWYLNTLIICIWSLVRWYLNTFNICIWSLDLSDPRIGHFNLVKKEAKFPSPMRFRNGWIVPAAPEAANYAQPVHILSRVVGSTCAGTLRSFLSRQEAFVAVPDGKCCFKTMMMQRNDQRTFIIAMKLPGNNNNIDTYAQSCLGGG